MGGPCRPLEPWETPKLLEAMDGQFSHRNRGLVSLGICTGFRINELLSLKVADLYHYGKVHDRLRIPKRFMKGNKPRYPKKIFPEAKAHLEQWYKELRGTYEATRRSYVFVSNKGGRLVPHSCWYIINKAAEDAGLNTAGIGTHTMRKTFANAVYDYWAKKSEEGMRVEPMRMVQFELGHSDINDTFRYLAFKMEEKPDELFVDYDLWPAGHDRGKSSAETSKCMPKPVSETDAIKNPKLREK